METDFDVIIVGGGVAGLSAGLMLTRARRRVVIFDSGSPRNRFTAHMHAVLGHEAKPPAVLLDEGRRDFEAFGGIIVAGSVVGARRRDDGVEVTLGDDSTVSGRRLIVTTGLRDELLEIEGLDTYWGRGAASCPYCDGYEVRDRHIAILATGDESPFQAQLLRQWTSTITYFEHDTALDEDQRTELEARGIDVISGRIGRIAGDDDDVTGIALVDGTCVDVNAIFTAPKLVAIDNVLVDLGADFTHGPFGRFVTTDPTGRTSIDGVWAAGNVADPMANIPMSMGRGSATGGAVNSDLVKAEIASALASRVS